MNDTTFGTTDATFGTTYSYIHTMFKLQISFLTHSQHIHGRKTCLNYLLFCSTFGLAGMIRQQHN